MFLFLCHSHPVVLINMVAILKAPVAFYYTWCRLFIQLSCPDAPRRVPAIQGAVSCRHPPGSSARGQVASAHAVAAVGSLCCCQRCPLLTASLSGFRSSCKLCPSLLLALEVASQKSAGEPVRTRSLPPSVTVNPPPSLSAFPCFLCRLGHHTETPGSLGSRVKRRAENSLVPVSAAGAWVLAWMASERLKSSPNHQAWFWSD